MKKSPKRPKRGGRSRPAGEVPTVRPCAGIPPARAAQAEKPERESESLPSPSSSLPRTNPLKKSGPYPVPPSAVHPSNHSVRVSCCSHARCAFDWSKRLTFVPSSAVCCLPAGPYLAPRSHPPSLNLNVFVCLINCHSPLGHLPLSPGRHPTSFGPLLATLIPLPPPPSQTKPSPTPAMPATKGETILHHYPDIVSS
jgi:hypothetical protein